MTIEISETFYPKNRAAWRQWLTSHHADKKEIWLVFYKKHTGKSTIAYPEAVNEALCFGWIDGMEKRLDEARYGLRFTPRSPKSNWSENNVKRYQELLAQGQMTSAGTAAFERKAHVYTSFSNKKGATQWHLIHKMPKNPTLEQRIEWHKGHKKFCSCRPVPKSLEKYF